MAKSRCVAIVGVGLIGGSLGLALCKRKLASRVIGIGRNPASLKRAKQRGAVHEVTTDLAQGVQDADLVVVCTPVDQIVEFVLAVRDACPKGAIITDAGSTKAGIVAEIEKAWPSRNERDVHFVGSHPIAGSEKTGVQHASADLFEQRSVIVTPTAKTSAAAVAKIVQFWKQLGANVTSMSPDDHDRVVAAISHVPHLFASAVAAGTPTEYVTLAAGGWSDTTRVAAGDPDLWRQILLTNRQPVLEQLTKVLEQLNLLRDAVAWNDSERLLALLEQGKRIRDAVAS
jgi:prephenate dehydrogenase